MRREPPASSGLSVHRKRPVNLSQYCGLVCGVPRAVERSSCGIEKYQRRNADRRLHRNFPRTRMWLPVAETGFSGSALPGNPKRSSRKLPHAARSIVSDLIDGRRGRIGPLHTQVLGFNLYHFEFDRIRMVVLSGILRTFCGSHLEEYDNGHYYCSSKTRISGGSFLLDSPHR